MMALVGQRASCLHASLPDAVIMDGGRSRSQQKNGHGDCFPSEHDFSMLRRHL
jgi:hypothetical protein